MNNLVESAVQYLILDGVNEEPRSVEINKFPIV